MWWLWWWMENNRNVEMHKRRREIEERPFLVAERERNKHARFVRQEPVNRNFNNSETTKAAGNRMCIYYVKAKGC